MAVARYRMTCFVLVQPQISRVIEWLHSPLPSRHSRFEYGTTAKGKWHDMATEDVQNRSERQSGLKYFRACWLEARNRQSIIMVSYNWALSTRQCTIMTHFLSWLVICLIHVLQPFTWLLTAILWTLSTLCSWYILHEMKAEMCRSDTTASASTLALDPSFMVDQGSANIIGLVWPRFHYRPCHYIMR